MHSIVKDKATTTIADAILRLTLYFIVSIANLPALLYVPFSSGPQSESMIRQRTLIR